MDQQLPWTVGDIPDWLDIDVANSVSSNEYGPRSRSLPLTQPEQAGLHRHDSAVRYSFFMSALEEEEKKKEPAPGPSTLAAESPSQAQWRKAEEASESRALKKIRNRSGRVPKDGQKRTRKMTERTRELRRGRTRKGKVCKDKVKVEKEEEEELNAKMGDMSLPPLPELETSMGDMSICEPDTPMGGDC